MEKLPRRALITFGRSLSEEDQQPQVQEPLVEQIFDTPITRRGVITLGQSNDEIFYNNISRLDQLLSNAKIDRRTLFRWGFELGVILTGLSAVTIVETNPAIQEVVTNYSIECSADTSETNYTLEELMHNWYALNGDSIVRAQADGEMSSYGDVDPPTNNVLAFLRNCFGADPAILNVYQHDPHDISFKQPSRAEIIKMIQQEFTTHELGSINLGYNGVPLEVIDTQLDILAGSGFFYNASCATLCDSGGGNNPNRLFANRIEAIKLQSIAKNALQWGTLPAFNEIDEQIAPLADKQFDNLEHTKRLFDQYGNIHAMYIYGNVNLKYSEGLVTPLFLGDEYEVIETDDPIIRDLASIYCLALQKRKREGINRFLDKYPNPGFDILFLDLYNLLGNGELNGERTFLYEHPTRLGYDLMAFEIMRRMTINGKPFPKFEVLPEKIWPMNSK